MCKAARLRDREQGSSSCAHDLGSELSAGTFTISASQWQQLLGVWMEQVFQDECLGWHRQRLMKQDHF